jgi:hypothetical protein
MPFIPNIIKDSGYSNIGLLSALFFKKNSNEFYGGLFHKENVLFMILNTHKSSFVVLEVSEQQVEDLLEEKTNLFLLLKENYKKMFILSNKLKNIITVFLMVKVFLTEKTKRIYIMSNSYYHWNQYKYLNHQR